MDINKLTDQYLEIECDKFLDSINCKFTKGRYFINKALQLTVRNINELSYLEALYMNVNKASWQSTERCIRYAIASSDWAGMKNREFLHKATMQIRKILHERSTGE